MIEGEVEGPWLGPRCMCCHSLCNQSDQDNLLIHSPGRSSREKEAGAIGREGGRGIERQREGNRERDREPKRKLSRPLQQREREGGMEREREGVPTIYLFPTYFTELPKFNFRLHEMKASALQCN